MPFPSPFASWKWDLAQTKKAILEEKGRETQGKRTDLLSNVDKKLEQPHNTQAEIAKELGWSTGKVAMAAKISEATQWVCQFIDTPNNTRTRHF